MLLLRILQSYGSRILVSDCEHYVCFSNSYNRGALVAHLAYIMLIITQPDILCCMHANYIDLTSYTPIIGLSELQIAAQFTFHIVLTLCQYILYILYIFTVIRQ